MVTRKTGPIFQNAAKYMHQNEKEEKNSACIWFSRNGILKIYQYSNTMCFLEFLTLTLSSFFSARVFGWIDNFLAPWYSLGFLSISSEHMHGINFCKEEISQKASLGHLPSVGFCQEKGVSENCPSQLLPTRIWESYLGTEYTYPWKTREYGIRAKCVGQTVYCYRNLDERQATEGWRLFGGERHRTEPELVSDGWGRRRQE